ncbi:hypothetical protein STCU_05455 [Strigomonas culicis]|nr:hypothetical protein STCU_07905 [Strigomonas culicis]EPY27883.1 hypothetical protein STCU_05455 [Strigomonas culicis]|eukprot:EPY23053.1 hypothetical protein STCU_07905 [Strigomonas culicis]
MDVGECCASHILPVLFAQLYLDMRRVQAFDERFERTDWGLCLMDVTAGMREPCVMDLKLGCYRVSHMTRQAKVHRVEKKDSGKLVRQVGLRFTWMRRFAHVETVKNGVPRRVSKKETVDKKFGYHIHTAAQLAEVMRAFFSTNDEALLHDIVRRGSSEEDVSPRVGGSTHHVAGEQSLQRARRRAAGERISKLIHFFEKTGEGLFLLQDMAFVSSNVLFVYDAAEEDLKSLRNASIVYFIDFAHSCPRHLNFEEEKLGFVKGLKNTYALLFNEPLV